MPEQVRIVGKPTRYRLTKPIKVIAPATGERLVGFEFVVVKTTSPSADDPSRVDGDHRPPCEDASRGGE
jgi:hypothetical protein